MTETLFFGVSCLTTGALSTDGGFTDLAGGETGLAILELLDCEGIDTDGALDGAGIEGALDGAGDDIEGALDGAGDDIEGALDGADIDIEGDELRAGALIAGADFPALIPPPPPPFSLGAA